MKRSKFKINVGFKKVLASFLTITMLGFQANIMAFASNITGVTGNNGVYNINPSRTSGSTGFRHYNDFTLDNGHTANLIFDGINRFVNAVDNQVTINGILNSVNGSGAFANGRAIFISPKGFVVGSSGVVNVGSLGVYTPSASAYNSFKNLSVDKMTDALLNGDAYYGNGAITISGMILTRESLDLKGGTVKINDSAKIASGILDKNTNAIVAQNEIARASSATNARNNATTLFNKLVNSGKANFASDEFNFASNNGNITIAAKGNLDVNGTTVANGKYVLKQTGEGNLNTSGTSIANGDVSIIKNGAGSVNVGGTLTNAKGGAKTYIGNESASGGDLSITGDVKTSGDTMIVQGGSGLLNISKTLNSGSATISSVNGSGINVADVNSSGNVVIENGARGSINVGSINASSVSIQNQNYKITANRAEGNDSGFITLKREDSDALAKDGGIVTNGDIRANYNILIQNSGSKGIETNGNIIGNNHTSTNIKIITDNGGINLKSGKIQGYNVKITGANNATGDIKIDANLEGAVLVENAGKGNVIINGNINSSGSSGNVVIENQTYDIIANRVSDGNYKVLDVKRYNRNSQNLSGGIIVNGKILGDYVYIQNAGAKSITTTNDITGRNIYITNDGGSINLNSGKLSAMNDMNIFNLRNADSINIGADIESNSISDAIMSCILIANLGKGDLKITGNLFAKNEIAVQNQIGNVAANRVGFNGGAILRVDGFYHDPSVNINADSGIEITGNITSNKLVTIQNAGKKGITMDSNIRAGEFVENESGEMVNQGVISVINDGGNINITGGTLEAPTVSITNTNKGGSLTTKANINASKIALIENAGKGDMTVDGDITGGKILLENQTYNIVAEVTGTCNNYLMISRLDAPSSNTNGGLIASGNILGETVYIQNSGVNGITSNANVTSQGNVMITNNNGDINLVSGDVSGNNVTISNSNQAGALTTNANINASGIALIENAGKGDMTVGGSVQGSIVSLQNQTYDIETPRKVIKNEHAADDDNSNNDNNNNNLIILEVKRSDKDSANKDGGLVVNGSVYGDSAFIQNAGKGGITTNNSSIIASDVIITNDNGSININDGMIYGNDVIISNSNKGNELNVSADIEALNAALIENAGKGDMTVGGSVQGPLVSLQNQTYDIEAPRYVADSNDLIILNLIRKDAPSANKNGGLTVSGNINGGQVYIQNAGAKGITTSGDITGASSVNITNDAGNINLASGTINSSQVVVSNSNNANELKVGANIESEDGIVLIENAGSGNMTVNGNISGNSIVLLENQTYDIVTPRLSGNGLILLDVNRVDAPSSNTNGGLILNGNVAGSLVYIQNLGANGITSNSSISSLSDVMITNNNGNINLVSGDIFGENVIVSNSNKAGSLTANSNINASNLALIENAGNGDMTVGGNVQGALVSLQNQTYDIETPRYVTQSNGLITLGVTRKDAPSKNRENSLVTSGTLSGGDVYVQNSGKGGIKSNSDIQAQNDVMITNNGGSINLESGNISGKNVIVSNSNQATGGILVGANINSQKTGKLVVENAAPGSIILNGNLNGNGGYVIIENQTYDIETPRVVYGDFIVLDVNRINKPSQNVDGGIIANGTISGGDVFIQNAGSQGITINNDIISDNLMVTNDNGGINIGNVNITALNRNVLISNSSNATEGVKIAANVKADNGDVVVENSGNGNIELTDKSALTGKRVLVENQTYDITTPRVPEGNYILLGVERNKVSSPNKNGGIIANGKISAKDIAYIQNSGEKGIASSGNIKGGDVAITNNGGAINLSEGDIEGNNIIISQSNQGEGGVTIGANVKGADRVLIENAGKGDITIGGNVNGKKVSIQNQTYDIETPQVKHNDGLITLDVTRIDQDSPNKDGGIKITGNVTGTEDNKIQNSGEKGITSSGNIKGGDIAITNNGGAINLSEGDIEGNKVIISQSNQGEGGVTIGANVKGTDRIVIENAGKGDITIGGNVNGKKVSIQNQTYDIITPRNTDDNPYISLDVTRIDQDSPNKDGGIKITGNVTGTEDNKIQNSGEKGITSNGEVKGGDVDITNNGGDVNINGKVDGDDVTISNSDNGGDVNINGKVGGNDVLVENNGSGNINNPQNVNGNVKDHEYTIETPRNTDDNPYISLDVKRGTPFPKPTPEPTPTPVIRDNDPTRLIYDKKRDDSFLELKRESIRYGINGDSLSLNSASNHIQGIVDISKTGLAVKTDGSLKINDEVKVNFAYKGIEVEATAKVMRVNQANNIAGLKFTDLDALTANKILYLSMLIEAQKEQTASNNQNQQPSFMNVLSKL